MPQGIPDGQPELDWKEVTDEDGTPHWYIQSEDPSLLVEVVPEFHIRATSFDDESVATFREAKWLSLRHAKVSGETIMAEAIKEFGGDASP